MSQRARQRWDGRRAPWRYHHREHQGRAAALAYGHEPTCAAPWIDRAQATDDVLYRKARNELLKSFAAHGTSWASCTHAGFACRTLLYEADDGRKGMARLYLHGGVLVVINAIYDEDADIAQRFLASAH